MGIPEHNLCVRNHKWERENRRKTAKVYSMRPRKYMRKNMCKTRRKYRFKQIFHVESDMLKNDIMKRVGVSTVRELRKVMNWRTGRYGKYDD